ncbi:TPA: restriction endonuclease subunit S [Aeromonas veronii]
MESNVKTYELRDLASVRSSKRVKMADYVADGVPFFRSKEIIELAKGNKISTELFISNEHYDDIKSKYGVPLKGDILITSVGTLGVPYILPDNSPFYFKDGNLTWLSSFDVSKVFPPYIFYWLRSPIGKHRLDSIAIGTTQRALTITALNGLKIELPSIAIQKKIVKIISSIENKITANTAMNQTLEKIAQRIFKSWFIDFDPVKANAEGVPFNGLSPEIQALFPNKLVDSGTEFGLIPEGWNPSSIGVEFDVTMGQSPPGSSYNEEKVGVKFFQGRRDFSFRFPSERVYTTDPKRMAKSDDTLISVRAPVGDINMAMDDCCIGRGLGALRHKKDLTSYTYYLMQSIKPVFDKFESNGTVFGSINQNELKAIQYVAPDIKVLEEFEKVVRGLDKKIRENLLQNLNLTSIKEKILPRLITGKIQLSDANQELKETV